MSGAFVPGRHPDTGVELRVACGGEGVGPIEGNWLACQHLDWCGVICGHRIVRQVGMEVEGRDAIEEADLVQILVDAKGRNLRSALDEPGAESKLIHNRDSERLH